MEVAPEVFGEKGYGGGSISEIAGKAGIAEATIYQYLRTKEQLLLSVLGTLSIELADELERGFSRKLNAYEQLLYLLRRWAPDFQIEEWETRVLVLE